MLLVWSTFVCNFSTPRAEVNRRVECDMALCLHTQRRTMAYDPSDKEFTDQVWPEVHEYIGYGADDADDADNADNDNRTSFTVDIPGHTPTYLGVFYGNARIRVITPDVSVDIDTDDKEIPRFITPFDSRYDNPDNDVLSSLAWDFPTRVQGHVVVCGDADFTLHITEY